MEFPGDLDYGDITSGSEFLGLQEKLNSPFTKTIADNFEASYRRIVHMHGLPFHVAYWASALATADRDPQVIAKLSEIPPPQNFIQACERAVIALKEGGFIPGKDGDNPLTFGIGFIRHMQYTMAAAPYETNFVIHALESIFFAMLSTSYSAFEAMASDLWVEAVNHDYALAENVFKRASEKQIPTSTLVGYGFDLRHSMGKILKEQGKVSFANLSSIRNAYRDAFGSDTEAIFGSTPDVVLAEKIRHLIAHRGGVVDQKFKDEAGDHSPLGDVRIGNHITLTGPIVSRFADACIGVGAKLLLFVDRKTIAAASEIRG